MRIDFWLIIKGLLWVLWKFWPIWLLLLAFAIFALLLKTLDLKIDRWRIRRRFKQGEQWRSDRELLHWLRSMSPTEFETYIANLFSRLGYTARAVGGSYDRGIDVIAEKDGITNYIQCKKFITQEVSVGAVRDFYGSLADHIANGQGYFITTNKFTLEARKFAEDKPIQLIDDSELVRYIHLAEKDSKFQESSSRRHMPYQCPRCGGALVERNGKFGKFLGCSNYPRCKYTADVR